MDPFFDLMATEVVGKSLGLWLGFLSIVGVLIIFDLGVLNKKDKALSFKKSLYLTFFYIAISILYGIYIWFHFGTETAVPFFTAYLVEKSLSLDNIFVMSVIFGYYGIPLKYQHRVLFWGILGVLILRGIVIALGTYITAQFSWILFIFGGLLVYTGVRIMLTDEDDAVDLENSKIRKVLTANFNVTNQLKGNRFFIWKKAKLSGIPRVHLTPLFMALITIEFADLLFAMDSIPAVLAISSDTFVIFTSNIFAILGLRAMYFMLAALLERFKYLKYALSIVLIFIGAKIFYSHIFGKIDPMISLVITMTVLIGGAIISFAKTKGDEAKDGQGSAE